MAKVNSKMKGALQNLQVVNALSDVRKYRDAMQAGAMHEDRTFDLTVLDALVLLLDNVLGIKLPDTQVAAGTKVADTPLFAANSPTIKA